MSSFMFQAERRPFPRWMGPYSPARGKYSGFRFHQGRLGTWVNDDTRSTFWPACDGPGSKTITELVKTEWCGGRVFFLPNGYVVKPLQDDDEIGQRVIIGRFSGSLVLRKPDGSTFDLGDPGNLRPGDRWPGPKTIGLECSIQQDGSLICRWYHPKSWGREGDFAIVHGRDQALAHGFRLARPRDSGGRVRVTANGHVITNRQESNENWTTLYVGQIGSDSTIDWHQWIKKERI